MKSASLTVCVAASVALTLEGAVKMADPFADGMVLQRDRDVPVWGTAEPGEKVVVAFAGKTAEAVADSEGKWMCRLPPLAMSKDSRQLVASAGDSRQVVDDVLVGDVWFVSGQSNCEFPLCGTNPHFSDRNGAAIASITHMPLVRYCYQSNYRISAVPKTRAALPVKWRRLEAKNLLSSPSFSAIGSYFAMYVHQASGVPLGLVGAYWGGTGVDPWTPREGTASRPDLKDILDFPVSDNWDGVNPKSIFRMNRKQDQPAVLFNEMVNPWCPFAMKGLVWYQGCTNSREPERYCSKMHALYNGWSQKFECPDMRLYFVQLAPWGFEGIAKIQEAQADFEREQPNAGMAVINDVGNLADIHPNEKGTVGLRLARMALKRDYGFSDIEENSPRLKSWRVENGSFVLDFDHAKRLYVYTRNYSADAPFEVAGTDGVFKPAKIENAVCTRKTINGKEVSEFKGNISGSGRIVVKSDEVAEPVRLRYCHSRPWQGTVYNEANLPLGAFHIDGTPSGDSVGFSLALPIWTSGRLSEMNDSVLFRSSFVSDGKCAKLRIAGCSLYRIRLNGAFAGYGPARGPKGFYRVDEWPLKPEKGTNELEVLVSAYNCNNYYVPDQSPFLQAEIIADAGVLAATGAGDSFRAYSTDRVRKVPRYSLQRGFSEAYRVGSPEAGRPLKTAVRPAVALLPRRVGYPDFKVNESLRVVSRAKARANPEKKIKKLPYIEAEKANPARKEYYLIADCDENLWREGLCVDYVNRRATDESWPVKLAGGDSVMVDAGINDCGFPMLKVSVKKPGKLMLVFDEILVDGEVDASRMNCCNVVAWTFERPGDYELEAFEPYVWRYANLFTLDGEMEVLRFAVREYKNSGISRASFRSSDPALDRIFAAAKETFAQNAVDVFSDCPGRERAGWLCDSFFTGRVSKFLTGDTVHERLFLENYAIPESFDNLPRGMVAMCYPADHATGNFIPNWAMWLVIEADEYFRRSGDRGTVDALRPRFEALVGYLRTFRNSDGLLEKLPKWVFVEWSQANKLVQDVNYPSNMTFAEALDAMDRLYGRPDLAAEAAKMRETIRRQSWTGKWFCDNAVRQGDGTLKLSGECTETCQYYAFFFRTATPETHHELWDTLVSDFGPKRLGEDKVSLKSHPAIWPSNAFIGNYLRLECLSRAGLTREIYEETKDYFDYMARRTGTLWEFDRTTASCCHGFASHIAVTLYRDFLGVRSVDSAARTVAIAPPSALPVEWCEGDVPLSPTESMHVRVARSAAGASSVDVRLPGGWTRK